MSEEPFTRINSKVLDINLSVKEFRKATSVCVCAFTKCFYVVLWDPRTAK